MAKPNGARLKVGIISANWGVQAHLPAWRALSDDVEVAAICTAHQDTAEAAATAPRALPRPAMFSRSSRASISPCNAILGQDA
jgi:hypothetical protein